VLLLTATVLAAVTIVLPTTARAQVWGNWSNPIPNPTGGHQVGGHLLLGDLTGWMGEFRTGLGERFDVGGQIGWPDFDGTFGVGGDARFLFMPESDSLPLNLIANFGIGYFDVGSNASTLDFAFGVLAAKPIELSSGYQMVPHGGFLIDVGRIKAGDASATKTGVVFRGGAEFYLNQELAFNGELDINSRGSTAVYVSLGATYYFGDW
jgi:hypothetical protein